MPTISSIVSEFDGVRERIERSVRVAVTRGGYDITSRLRTSSPSQTGELQYGWRLGRASSTTGILASISITNRAPHAAAIEYGIDPSDVTHSWAMHFRNPLTKKGKSKIMLKGGRIWSSSAIGGVSQQAITASVVRDLAVGVADAIISAIAKKA